MIKKAMCGTCKKEYSSLIDALACCAEKLEEKDGVVEVTASYVSAEPINFIKVSIDIGKDVDDGR